MIEEETIGFASHVFFFFISSFFFSFLLRKSLLTFQMANLVFSGSQKRKPDFTGHVNQILLPNGNGVFWGLSFKEGILYEQDNAR